MAMTVEESMAVRTLFMWLYGVPSEWNGQPVDYDSAEKAALTLAEKASKGAQGFPTGIIRDRMPLVKPLKVPKVKKGGGS